MRKHQNILAFLLILFLLSVAYLPLLQGYFVAMDDYPGCWLWDRESISKQPSFEWMAQRLGRPLGGFLIAGYAYFTRSIADARWIRFLHVIILGLIGFVFCFWLRRNHIRPIRSILLAVIVMTLPSFQVFAAHVLAAPYVVGILASELAFLAAFKSTVIKPAWRGIAGWYAFLAVGLLLVSLMCNQLSAMFYWCMLGVFLLSTDIRSWKKQRGSLFNLFFIAFFSMGIYFFYYAVLSPRLGLTSHTAHYTMKVSGDWLNKIWWFIVNPLPGALNLWNIFPSGKITLACGIFILAGFFFEALSVAKKRMGIRWFSSVIQRDFLIVILLFLSCLPILARGFRTASYRTLLALSPLIVVMLYWAARQMSVSLPDRIRSGFLTAFLVVGCLTGIYCAHDNAMNRHAFPNTLELRYFKRILRLNDPAEYERIHIIGPETDSFTMPRAVHDEFGRLVVNSQPNGAAVIKCAAGELSTDPQNTRDTKWIDIVDEGKMTITYHYSYIPYKVGKVRFERNILGRVPEIEDREFLLSFYTPDGKGNYMFKHKAYNPGEVSKLLKILNSTDYSTDSNNFDEKTLIIDMRKLEYFY